MSESQPQGIYVLAGANGAGKSSIAGRAIDAAGGFYFNADEATQRILEADPSLTLDDANSKAWLEMVRLLSVAIANGEAYVFETTLGGSTIAGHLRSAASAGLDVRIWYVALANSDLHIARVQRRVLAGGHDVPDERIRARYDSSRANLLELMPVLKELWVYDNSEDLEDAGDQPPEPSLILYMADGKIVQGCPMEAVPEWAKSIVLTAIRLSSPE